MKNNADNLTAPRSLELRVTEHQEVARRMWRMVLDAGELAAGCAPGQFAHVLCGESYDPLLRRPLSIHDVESGTVALLYEIRGRGTALLSQKRPGETVSLIGPLGNGFTLPATSERPVLLVAGGMGSAPLYFLARRIVEQVGREAVTLALGARSAELLVCRGEYASLETGLCLATDDGSLGLHGLVPQLVRDYLRTNENPLIYACGPLPMLRAVAAIAKERGLPCQVSLEAKMACGVGACMSCVIKVRDGEGFKYVRCCKEGPVFDASEVVWE